MANKVPIIKAGSPTRVRNAFDLSQRHLFTAKAGQLLPLCPIELMPHDHVEINASDFMRLMETKHAPFLTMRSVYEFFAVPIHQLWSPFDQFITGMSDYHSDFYIEKGTPKSIPAIDFYQLKSYLSDLNADGIPDILGFSKRKGALKILDLLGYFGGDPTVMPTDTLLVNPFRILAYNKIYQDWYRNTNYESYNASTFNIDSLTGQTTIQAEKVFDPAAVRDGFLQMHYRNWALDLMTNIRPSLLFKPDVIPSQFFVGNAPLTSSHPIALNKADYNNDVGVTPNSNNANASSINQASVPTVASIRNAFAVDKLCQLMMRAGKTYQEQMKAVFGVEVPVGRDHRCNYLGGFTSDMQISDVTQTSDNTGQTGDNGYLGKIGGKGTSSGSGKIVFDAKEHCILMCIYSLVPVASYDSTRLDPFNRKLSRGDYFLPEFEDLGMQPLYQSDINCNYTQFDGIPNHNHTFTTVCGWQPRYSEYKTAIDQCHGQFRTSLSSWCCSRFSNEFVSVTPTGIFDGYFKVNPRVLDRCLAIQANDNENTDQVFGGAYFNIIKVSDMSEQGLPSLK